jgi:hypothetical protein
LQLPSLLAYVIVAQDKVEAWLYSRDLPKFPEPEVIKERDGAISIPALNIVVPLADVYDGIEFEEPT